MHEICYFNKFLGSPLTKAAKKLNYKSTPTGMYIQTHPIVFAITSVIRPKGVKN